MRKFNTSGPIVPEDHYCIPPLDRMDLRRVLELIADKRYFIVHAPRQTGKTSSLLALQDLLNSGSEGNYRCLYTNFEAGGPARENIHEAMRAILNDIGSRARSVLGDDYVNRTKGMSLEAGGPFGALVDLLNRWSEDDSRPVVLLIDEIDSLEGDTLLSVLRQLRSGYDRRPASFPQSIVLCGVRNLRDYKIHARSEITSVTGGSAFNISAGSLRLGDFSEDDVRTLLAQHTSETGQRFLPEAIQRIWTQTSGQPWLVNALCNKACFENAQGRDRSRGIAEEDIVDAQEQLILERVTHLDQFMARLNEDRVRRVIEPLLSGELEPETPFKSSVRKEDLEYVRDLGLIAQDPPTRIANPIYREVVPRELTSDTQDDLRVQPAWYIDPELGLQMTKLMAGFQDFFRQHSQYWLGRFDYEEAGPQLLLQAYLQRVVNSGGRIEREYGAGRGRMDLFVTWSLDGREQRFVIECKLLRDGLENAIRKGLKQTAGYMDTCGAEEGHLVIFDRERRLWKDKVFRESHVVGASEIEVWGM